MSGNTDNAICSIEGCLNHCRHKNGLICETHRRKSYEDKSPEYYRLCRKVFDAKRYQANKEAIKARQRKYYVRNREARIEYDRARRRSATK